MSDLERVFGLHAVQALLDRHPKRIKRLLLQAGRLNERQQAVLALAERQGVALQRVAGDELDAQAEGVHQGVVAEVVPSQLWSEEMLGHMLDRLEGTPLLLVLDGVTDPHNLGACLRSADAAGVDAVVVPRRHAAGLTPVACRSAAGAAEALAYFEVGNLARVLEMLKDRRIQVAGTALNERSQSLFDFQPDAALAVVMGAEGEGLRRLTLERCDDLIAIPMAGDVQSLNVSVATGVVLFHIRARRPA